MSDITNSKTDDNLKIWNQVCQTDPKYTKPFKGPGGFEATSINAEYSFLRATEVFGPVGKGWGYNITEDTYDVGGPLPDTDVLAQISTVKIQLWYKDKKAGETYFIEGVGQTPFVYSNKYGVQTDFEARKKSITDAVKKCLSLLGFSADIFLGEFDDPYYVHDMRERFDLEHAEDKAEEKAKQDANYREWKETMMGLIESSVHMNELQKLFESAVRKAKLRGDDKFIVQATKAKDKRKTELTKPKKEDKKSGKAV